MGRPRGKRNPGYEERRAEIARAAMGRIVRPDGARASLRELAAAAGVSLATVRHYFGDRDGLVVAAMEEMRAAGAVWLERARTAELDRPLPDSLRWYLDTFAAGWELGVGIMFSQGLAAGLDGNLGPPVVDELLEPTLQATEARLAHHVRTGELEDGDLRHAALELLCPVLLALLHQDNLGGRGCRPLDLPAFLDDHVRRFVRAWGAAEASRRGEPAG